MKQPQKEAFEHISQELQRLNRLAKDNDISFYGAATLDDDDLKETDVTQNINMAPHTWASVIAGVIENFPGFEEATLLGIRMAELSDKE